ncbi:Uncharacterized protein DAT39_012935, partial [Clarias magur]
SRACCCLSSCRCVSCAGRWSRPAWCCRSCKRLRRSFSVVVRPSRSESDSCRG